MIEPRTEIVLPGEPMMETISFFRERLSLQLESIMPAEEPRLAVFAGNGIRIVLDADHHGAPGLLQIRSSKLCEDLHAPNGTRIRYTAEPKGLAVPIPDDDAVVTRQAGPSAWTTGRANMQYRDLIPNRMNGYLIASHIRIPAGGPVADDVHFHDVRFQLIYCYRGWARLVYEDQGEPFILKSGDCVLQPPRIRHRVLESSEGLEVIEIACPSSHLTTIDYQLTLPTNASRPNREFSGQRFHWHQHQHTKWQLDDATNWSIASLGISEATRQLADATILRANGDMQCIDDSLTFWFVITGSCQIRVGSQPPSRLAAADCATIPRNQPLSLQQCSEDLEILRVRLS